MNDPVTIYRKRVAERQNRRDCAELAYNYPQYTLEDAVEMPVGDRRLLITFARLHQAESQLELLTTVAASQSKAGYKKKREGLEGVIKQLEQQL